MKSSETIAALLQFFLRSGPLANLKVNGAHCFCFCCCCRRCCRPCCCCCCCSVVALTHNAASAPNRFLSFHSWVLSVAFCQGTTTTTATARARAVRQLVIAFKVSQKAAVGDTHPSTQTAPNRDHARTSSLSLLTWWIRCLRFVCPASFLFCSLNELSSAKTSSRLKPSSCIHTRQFHGVSPCFTSGCAQRQVPGID